MKHWKVAKFGGTSNKDAKAMLQSCQVVKSDSQIRVVVVSAMAKTTSELRKIAQLCYQSGVKGHTEAKEIIQKIKDRHIKLAEEIKAGPEAYIWIEKQVAELSSLAHGIALLEELSAKTMDRMMAFGEKLSSRLFVEALKHSGIESQFFDVQEVMLTSNDYGRARPMTQEIALLVQEKMLPLAKKQLLVTQGFIGRTKEGETTTLGLEGSDYTAAILAEALEFSEVQIWTDVDGIYSTDPRIVPTAQHIHELDFKEAESFSFFGAKVLHPNTLTPAKRKKISIYIGNSQRPESQGSWIHPQVAKRPEVRSMALKEKQQLLRISPGPENRSANFYEKVFRVLWHLGLDTDMTQIINGEVMVLLDGDFQLNDDHRDGLQSFQWSWEENFSLLTIIGSNFSKNQALLEQVFKNIKQSVHGVFYGANDHTLSLLLEEKSSSKTLDLLHRELIER